MAYTLLFLRNYNNYFNRTVKRLNTASEYEEAVGGSSAFLSNWVTFENVNFVPNDGVSTSQVINWAFGSLLLDWQPDYTIVWSEDGVFQRWFVVESKRLRNGQYQFSLKRDTVADYLEQITNSPAYIRRGMLGADDPLIFQSEGLSLNQVKKEERPITDKSRKTYGDYPERGEVAYKYIVGYFGRDNFQEATDIEVPIGSSSLESDLVLTEGKTVSDWASGMLGRVQYLTPSSEQVRVVVAAASDGKSGFFDYFTAAPYNNSTEIGGVRDTPNIDLSDLNGTSLTTSSNGPGYKVGADFQDGFYRASLELSRAVKLSDCITAADSNFVSLDDVNSFLSYDGKIVQDDNGKYKIRAQLGGFTWISFPIKASSALASLIAASDFLNAKGYTMFRSWDIFSTKTLNDNSIMVTMRLQRFIFESEELVDSIKLTIPAAASRTHCQDSAFDIFVMPIVSGLTTGWNSIEVNQAISVGQAILAKTTGAKDLQLLPFSPIQNKWNVSNGRWTITGGTPVKISGYDGFSIYFASTSQASFSISDDSFRLPDDPVELKIASETKIYRLCGPNYASIFAFNPYKNGGLLGYNVDCAFRPYQPYIHIAPAFGYLYGTDFNDSRGLTLTGDFSVDQVNDAWETYQLNNKNYQLTFDRQIDSLDVAHDIQRQEQIFSSIAGSFQGASLGAIAGAAVGGVPGAIAGGVIGGISSGAGGMADWVNLAKRQSEQINASRAYFSNALGNIKALPRTVSKINAYNPNNKVWPLLEIYETTSKEEEALRNLIAYRSMSVNAVQNLDQYINLSSPHWLQAEIIKIEGLNNDSHIASDIFQELSRGVFI